MFERVLINARTQKINNKWHKCSLQLWMSLFKRRLLILSNGKTYLFQFYQKIMLAYKSLLLKQLSKWLSPTPLTLSILSIFQVSHYQIQLHQAQVHNRLVNSNNKTNCNNYQHSNFSNIYFKSQQDLKSHIQTSSPSPPPQALYPSTIYYFKFPSLSYLSTSYMNKIITILLYDYCSNLKSEYYFRISYL